MRWDRIKDYDYDEQLEIIAADRLETVIDELEDERCTREELSREQIK